MASRVYIGLAEQSGRDGVRAVLADLPPDLADPRRADWSANAHRWAELAGAPRWVRAEVRQAARGGDPDLAAWALAFWLRGWAREDFDAERTRLLGIGPPRYNASEGAIVSTDDTAEELPRKHDARGPGRADLVDPEWWAEQQAAVEGCRGTIGVFSPRDRGELHGLELGCGARACPRCSKAAQWRAVSRYLAAFAAPLRTGAYRLEMFTLGSLRPVETPAELRAWRARLGQVCRAMVEGRETCGVVEGAWVGGLVVVETVRREGGAQFAHAHLLIVARRWYAWGLSEERLERLCDEAGVDPDLRRTENGRFRAGAVQAAAAIYNRGRARPVDPPALLGLREIQRRAGVGQVGQHDFINQPQTERIDPDGHARRVVVRYLSKVQQYAAKVGDDASFWTDAQIQWTVKGLRRCQPFGAFLRWHAGPTRRGSEVEPGADDPRALVAQVDPDAFRELARERADRELHPYLPPVTPDPADRFEWHRLNRGRIATWAPWAHVGDYLAALEVYRRPNAPARALDPRPVGLRCAPPPRPVAEVAGVDRELNPTGTPTADPVQLALLASERANAEPTRDRSRNPRKRSTPGRNRTSDLRFRNPATRGKPPDSTGPPGVRS